MEGEDFSIWSGHSQSTRKIEINRHVASTVKTRIQRETEKEKKLYKNVAGKFN